jgi:hypothetical protein
MYFFCIGWFNACHTHSRITHASNPLEDGGSRLAHDTRTRRIHGEAPEHGTKEAKVGETRLSSEQVGACLQDRTELGERIVIDFFDVIPGIASRHRPW